MKFKEGAYKFSEKSSSRLIILDDTSVEEARFIPKAHKYYLLHRVVVPLHFGLNYE